jgi:hypothetical protein
MNETVVRITWFFMCLHVTRSVLGLFCQTKYYTEYQNYWDVDERLNLLGLMIFTPLFLFFY